MDFEPESESVALSSPKDERKQKGKRQNLRIDEHVDIQAILKRWQNQIVLLLKSSTAY